MYQRKARKNMFRRRTYRRMYDPELDEDTVLGDVEKNTPKVHELVLMNWNKELAEHLAKHPKDLELRFRRKSPLLVAIKSDSFESFQVLMDKKADIEDYNAQHETALIMAINHKRLEMIDILLSRGANIRAVNRDHRCATELVIISDDVAILKLLHQNRNHVLEHDLHNGHFPIASTIENRARNCFNYIIGLKPPVQSFLVTRGAGCPIWWAIRMNDEESLLKLAGLPDFTYVINTSFDKGQTCLHLTSSRKKGSLTKILLENRAYIEEADTDGNTPLHVAADVENAKILFRYGASIYATNNNGETPIVYARNTKRNSVYQWLRLQLDKFGPPRDHCENTRPCRRKSCDAHVPTIKVTIRNRGTSKHAWDRSAEKIEDWDTDESNTKENLHQGPKEVLDLPALEDIIEEITSPEQEA